MRTFLLGLLIGASPLHQPADCPALFGDDSVRRTNAEHRAEVLISVDGGGAVVDVVHSADFRRPVQATVEGLELIGTSQDKDGTWHAHVELGEGAIERCAGGGYDLEVDDAIGSARVLAIVENAVLIEDSLGRLAYLPVPGRARPVWRLTWVSPWLLFESPAAASQGGRAPPKNPPISPNYSRSD